MTPEDCEFTPQYMLNILILISFCLGYFVFTYFKVKRSKEREFGEHKFENFGENQNNSITHQQQSFNE